VSVLDTSLPAPTLTPMFPAIRRFAVIAVDVVERFTGDQRVDPVDQGDAVVLHLVEPVGVGDPVVVARRGVAVLDDSCVLDRRLVGVDRREEARRVLTSRLSPLRRFLVVGIVEAGQRDLGVVEAGLDPEPARAPVARRQPFVDLPSGLAY
jgi:hypothetical protein